MKPARKLDRTSMKASAAHRAKSEREISIGRDSYRNESAVEFDDGVDDETIDAFAHLFDDKVFDDMEFDTADCDAQELAREIAGRVLH